MNMVIRAWNLLTVWISVLESFWLSLFNKVNKTMYVKRNNEAGSWDYCCSRKAISITYFECVYVALGPACIEHAPYCHLWPVQLYSIFPHNVINGTIFEKKIFLNIKYVMFLENRRTDRWKHRHDEANSRFS